MNWMQGMQNKAEKRKERNLDDVFLKGEQACKRQMQEHKETTENFIQNCSATVTYVRVY